MIKEIACKKDPNIIAFEPVEFARSNVAIRTKYKLILVLERDFRNSLRTYSKQKITKQF